MDMTQERLSTGKKVNSAIDNPSSYYTAQSLTNRASDLEGLLDSMGQGIQTIQAANEGIESITAFVQQAKAVANTARDTAVKTKLTADKDFTAVAADTEITIKIGDKTYKTKLTSANADSLTNAITQLNKLMAQTVILLPLPVSSLYKMAPKFLCNPKMLALPKH